VNKCYFLGVIKPWLVDVNMK